MDKILYFPRGVQICITPKSVVTNEFRNAIRKAFHDYTEGTAKAYRVQDKLAFIDRIRELNFPVKGEDLVTEFLLQTFDENDEVTISDLADRDNMANIVDEAVHRAFAGWHHWGDDHHLAEPACEFVAAAIEEVMKYDDKEDKDETD